MTKREKLVKCPKCNKVIRWSGRYLGGRPYHEKCYIEKTTKSRL